MVFTIPDTNAESEELYCPLMFLSKDSVDFTTDIGSNPDTNPLVVF